MHGVINGWIVCAILGGLALLGTLACALLLLDVWLARPERPSKPAYEPDPIRWPADPRAVWEKLRDAPPLDRPRNPPRWTSFEDYLQLVEPPQRAAGIFGACGVAVGVLLGVALWLLPPEVESGWRQVVVAMLPVLALVQVVLGVRTWWPPRRRALLRGQLERVERFGVLCDVHDSALEIPRTEDTGPIHTRLLLAAHIPDAQAARLHAAVVSWAARITTAAAGDALREAWGVRHAVPTEDVFGSGADGGFLIESSHEPGGWAILVEMDAVNGDTSRFRWVEKVFFRRGAGRSATQDAPR